MPAVRARQITALAAGGALALALAASPAAAQSPPSTTSSAAPTSSPPTTTTTPSAAPAKVFLKVSGNGQRIPVGGRIKAKGRIRPFVPGQRVEMRIARHGKVLRKARVAVKPVAHSNLGRFRIRSGTIIKPGPYRVTALHPATAQQARGRIVSKPIAVHYPDLDPGQTSSSVKVFTRLLAHLGYYIPRSRHYGSGVARAVLAFRKVNRMARTSNATPGIFHALAKGKGGFKLRYPGAGYHVEVDISRQVMVIANHHRARYIIAASTGAPATPTITGHYSVYRKDAGYNSEGMYYSSYWHNGYAIHGYASVPTFNASHGCVRIPIPDAIFVYNRLPVGTPVDTYY
jgi:peptidoglycan hydrolase-like protein with peptidoglycan-binding domain